MSKENIKNKLINLLNKKMNFKKDILINENFDLPLTGKVFRLSSVDLVYLFFEVENLFNIKIDKSYLVDYQFNSINSISIIINKIHIDNM